MASSTYYPPSPPIIPEGFAEVDSAYRRQTVMILLAVITFFVIYFALIALNFFFLAWCALGRWSPHPGVIFLRCALALPSMLWMVFLFKNLFRWGGKQKTYDVEIFSNEHPRLFDFLQNVCEETGAPMPSRVFVNFEVNAMASRDSSFFNLFLPSKQYLHIGLGLVNSINLTEFKAMIAHEFGHFSQKSGRIHVVSSFALYTIHLIVDGYDTLDDWLQRWSEQNPFIAWPAWIVHGFQFLFRKCLSGLWYVIFFFAQAHRREMEFHADRVAVSVTGSDAVVHLLHKSQFAEVCMQHAIGEVQDAMDHQFFTDNLFLHQTNAEEFLRRKNRKPDWGIPPALPEDDEARTQVFKKDDDTQAHMWESHPSNFDREENAKKTYLRTTFDERSPWILFDELADLRERVTFKFFRFFFKIPKDTEFSDAEEVQKVINEERLEIYYDPRYYGLYDFRNLVIDDVYAWAKEAAQGVSTIAPGEAFQTLYDVEVRHRAQLYNSRLREFNELNPIAKGWHKPKDNEFEFRGEIYDVRDSKKLKKKVEKELDADFAWLKEFDRKVFFTYFQLGNQQSQDIAEDLFIRYRFHARMQKIWQLLQDQQFTLNTALNFLQSNRSGRMAENHFRSVLSMLRESHAGLKEALRQAEDLTFPSLKNVPAGKLVRGFLLEGKLIRGLSDYETNITNEWLNKFLTQLNRVKKKVDRIHYKSLGAILALQEKIGGMDSIS